MKNIISKKIFSIDTLRSSLCVIYVGLLLHYSIAMWESRQRYGIIFLTLTLMIASLISVRKKNTFLYLKGNTKKAFFYVTFVISFVCGLYFWIEYPSLVWERAGDINNIDVLVSIVFIYLVIQLTWATSGPVIPVVTLFFIAYGILGHLLPNQSFFYHPYITLTRFVELSCAEINGVFGVLNQIGATWIAIFGFFAGFVQGFGGLDFVLRITGKLVGSKPTSMPQIAVLASMGFGGMSGSAGANAVSTGAFTIPTMKRFGMPPAMAAAVESVASGGGQVMPPILGAVAFVMCDYLNMYYYQILFASLFPSIIYFGSTMLSVHFLAKRYIHPEKKVEVNGAVEVLKKKMDVKYLLQGLPLLISFITLLLVFIVLRVNILFGGFVTIVSFLFARFIYDLIVGKGKPIFIWTYIKNAYEGTLKGTAMIIPIGAMLGSLGIVIRVLTSTGLGEKIAYAMVNTFGQSLPLLLFFTMIICIIFGMAVTTVAAYIIVVTLAAPALIAVGIPPLVAHFTVFYWAMLSAITPPVASVCVVTAGIANANFMKTCWESMKLGIPKFILPFIFITQPDILSFTSKGILPFIIASIGFAALSAGIQSGWGWLPQIVLLILSVLTLISTSQAAGLIFGAVSCVVFIVFWKKYADTVVPSTI